MSGKEVSNGSEVLDKGGYAAAKNRCPHANDHINTLPADKQKSINPSTNQCSQCTNDKENWLCLSCHQLFCGRYANGHMKAHFEQTGHAIAAGLGDLSFWCYGCDSYINHLTIPKVFMIYAMLHIMKFNEPPALVPSFPSEAKSAAAAGETDPSIAKKVAKNADDDDDDDAKSSAASATGKSDEFFCGIDGLEGGGEVLLKSSVLLDRLFGCIYGNALGDAYGLSTEFLDKAEVQEIYGNNAVPFPNFKWNHHNARWRRGDWTDDTDQMILIMDSISESNGAVNEKLFASKLRYWIRNGFPELGDQGGMGLGMTVGAVCHSEDFLTNPHAASERVWEQTGKKLAANGAVMRTSILGVLDYNDLNAVINNTINIAKTTHFDGRCLGSCVIVTYIIAKILQGAPCSTSADIESLIKEGAEKAIPFVQKEYHDEFNRHLNAGRIEDLALDEGKAIGYTFKCFGSGIWAFRQAGNDFKAIMNLLVREAGDADTNGAVAGALLGSRIGYRGLPQSWLAAMPHKRWLDKKVLQFLNSTGIMKKVLENNNNSSSSSAAASK